MFVAAALLVACAVFMFVDPRPAPIVLWDESRLAVNAVEMHQRGWSLVTTYGFAPDLWNTKPPLMIWLMNASVTLFGPAELSLRLPAMVAGLGTLLVVFVFVRRVTHSVATAALAVVLLGTSLAFYGPHGARTADYDPLLCFFTTSYLSLLYFQVHRRRPDPRLIFLAGALIAAAAMTKTVAGILPGVGVAVYLLVCGRFRRAFETPRYAIMVAAALVPLAAFYLVREQLAPGYLEAVWYNDFAGRYHDQLGPLRRPPWFFVNELTLDWMFSAGPLALLAPLGLFRLKGQARQALIFALCCVAAVLVLVSVPATRLIQYMLPALPWLAIACAISAADQFRRVFGNAASRDGRALLNPSSVLAALAILVMAASAVRLRYDVLPRQTYYPEASYGALFAALHDSGVRRVTVVEPGMDVSGIRAYAPLLRFYTLAWTTRGMNIDRVERLAPMRGGGALASCEPTAVAALIATGGEAVAPDGCAWKRPAPAHR